MTTETHLAASATATSIAEDEYDLSELDQLTHKITEKVFDQINNKSQRVVYLDVPFEDDVFVHEEIVKLIRENMLEKENSSPINSRLAIILTTLFALVIAFGLVTNVIIVSTFYKCKKLRTFRNAYIVNLAIR